MPHQPRFKTWVQVRLGETSPCPSSSRTIVMLSPSAGIPRSTSGDTHETHRHQLMRPRLAATLHLGWAYKANLRRQLSPNAKANRTRTPPLHCVVSPKRYPRPSYPLKSGSDVYPSTLTCCDVHQRTSWTLSKTRQASPNTHSTPPIAYCESAVTLHETTCFSAPGCLPMYIDGRQCS